MCMNHEYRPQVLYKLRGVIFMGDGEDRCMSASLFRWLGLRGIYVCSMRFIDDSDAIPILMQNDYEFRFTKHIQLNGGSITDAIIISISSHCNGLQSLDVSDCRKLTDASIISIYTHCTGLHSLNVSRCSQLTDASIISISTHCTGLQSLEVSRCSQLTDASIISIAVNCSRIQILEIWNCDGITDASLIAIANNCTGLQYLGTNSCTGLSDSKLRRTYKSISELRDALLSIYPTLP